MKTSFFQRHPSAEAFILLIILMHLYEGLLFCFSSDADGSIPMSTFLSVTKWLVDKPIARLLVIITLLVTAVMGLFGLAINGRLTFKYRILCFVPQFTLVTITSLGALHAVLIEHYADFVPRSWEFISADQIQRIWTPILYSISVSTKLHE